MEQATFYPELAEGPANGSAYWVHAKDGVRLRVGLWRAEQPRKGTVFLFPGRAEYVEIWGRTASAFNELGYTTIVIDWRGQGLAERFTEDRRTGHVNSFSDFQMDVAAMVQAANELDLPKPWNLVGHSMGACIGFRALTEGLPVEACAFTAPMFDIHLSAVERMAAWPLTWAAQALGKGHSYAPGYTGESYVLKNKFENNRLTTDSEMYQYWVDQAEAQSDLQIGGPSMGWLFQALKETKSLSKVRSPAVPCIAFCGDQDEVVSISAIQNRMERWPDGRFELIHGAKHELFLESSEARERILSQICDLFSTTSIDANAA